MIKTITFAIKIMFETDFEIQTYIFGSQSKSQSKFRRSRSKIILPLKIVIVTSQLNNFMRSKNGN